MASVTSRIDELRAQHISPSNYINIADFEKRRFDDGIAPDDLFPYDNIEVTPSMMGDVVEYLTRYMLLRKKQEAFKLPILGAKIGGYEIPAKYLLRDIRGLNHASIESACRLVSYNRFIFQRKIVAEIFGYDERFKVLQSGTADNIRIFVNRSVTFFKEHGPVVKAGFAFLPNSPACTSAVRFGIGDFLTADTLWDMKVQREGFKSKQALQVLMYWIMGQHSGQEIFKGIKKIGLYNPRQNTAYILDTARIPSEVISAVEREVICY